MTNKKKTLQERWNEDILTDNTQFEYCKQCKDCIFRDDGTVWSNHYEKAHCQKYPYPKNKPWEITNNKGDCPYRETSSWS